jgi:hypothetical protein
LAHHVGVTKRSATAHHLQSPKNRDRVIPFFGNELDDPTFVPRLSFKTGISRPLSLADITDTVSQAEDVAFFCDNSIFDDHVSPDTWEALLEKPGRLKITTHVLSELLPWLKVRPSHPVLKAMKSKISPLEIVGFHSLGDIDRAAGIYYTNLLRVRRAVIKLPSIIEEAAQITATSGNPTNAYAVAQKIFGERSAKLSRKGANDRQWTDEFLVFHAALHSLTTGQQSVILTKDGDIEEQFYKFFWFLDTHYRSMLLADLYAACFSAFSLQSVPKGLKNNAFQGENNILIQRPESLLHEVIPEKFRFVAVSCWRLGTHGAILTFGAEREMYRVLHTKGKTGGLNTDKLGERNFHAYLAPMDLPVDLRDSAAVAHDIKYPIPGSKVSVACLDTAQALFPVERHGHYERVSRPTTEQRRSLILPAQSLNSPSIKNNKNR